MRIVFWIGNDANQKALASKINAEYSIAGIVTETRKHVLEITAQKLFEKFFLPSISKSWWDLQKHYHKLFPFYPETRTVNVENINCETAFDFTKKLNPDLIIVSGTSLIGEKLLAIAPSIGILNLHTGLSPYIKGGPNCTNWCLATKQFHLIGNTIMWIDKGIDTGNILLTEHTTFAGDETLYDIHFKVMEHAHVLYLNALKQIIAGKYPSVKQSDIALGKTYYNKQWGLKEKIRLLKNLNEFLVKTKSGELEKLKLNVKTINGTI